MIDNNKLLSRDRMATGRNVVTIKRNIIKIDSLLKERLVLVKVRQGILKQQEQNRIRRQREEDLESLQSTGDRSDTSFKQGSNFLSGLVKSILGLTGIFLPQILRLLNFLKKVVDPIKKMATVTFTALSSFLKVGTEAVDKISDAFNFKGGTLRGLDADTITSKFSKFEFALNTFVNALLFAGAMQTLSSLPDIKSLQKFFKRIKTGSKVTQVRRGAFNDLAIEQLFKKSPFYQKLKAKDFLEMGIEYSDLPLKQRMANAFEMNKRGINRFPKMSRKGEQIKLEKQLLKDIAEAEKLIPELEIFDFLKANNLPSPTALKIEANDILSKEFNFLRKQLDDGVIDSITFRTQSRILESRYLLTDQLITQYGDDILTLFRENPGTIIAQTNSALKKNLNALLKKNPVINPILKKGVPILEKPFEITLGSAFNTPGMSISKKQFTKNLQQARVTGRVPGGFGAMALRAYSPGFEYDLIQPSILERGKSVLSGGVDFLKGIDQTMVDFATRQTSRVSKVIMSGPLKGLQEGAEKMLKRAVGETIGLIPFLGDLVGLLLDIYLFGEIPERAGYKAVGGILGGFVGALIGSIPPLVPFGGPIIGSIIGGIGGDILGGIVYDMVRGKDTKIKTSDVGSASVKSTVKEGLLTFGTGGFTGKGDSRQLAGLVHHNEQVFDPDTTLAVRQNAPGFFEDLNSAKGFESLEVLRNFASYEGTQTVMAQFIPIPIPMSKKETSPAINIATGEETQGSIYAYHYARG